MSYVIFYIIYYIMKFTSEGGVLLAVPRGRRAAGCRRHQAPGFCPRPRFITTTTTTATAAAAAAAATATLITTTTTTTTNN